MNTGEAIRMTVGIMGNAATALLFAAPILTFKTVIQKKSTEKYSCVPYIMALFNCLLYTWYGLPVVSHMWENFPVATVNGLGILLEISFISIYIWFASSEQKKSSLMLLTPVVTLFGMAAVISAISFHDHHHRKIFIGSMGFIASVSMYSSPLVAVKQVIKAKSVEFMPLNLSLFSFLSSSIWLAYGLLSRDPFITAPNVIGCPMAILQLVVYYIYRKGGKVPEKPHKVLDLEMNNDVIKQEKELNCEKNDQ